MQFCWNNKIYQSAWSKNSLICRIKVIGAVTFWRALTESSVQNNKLWKKLCLEILQYTQVFTCSSQNQCQVYSAEPTIMICPCELDQKHSLSYSTPHELHILDICRRRLFSLPATHLARGGNYFSAYVLMSVSKSFNSRVIKRLLILNGSKPVADQVLIACIE